MLFRGRPPGVVRGRGGDNRRGNSWSRVSGGAAMPVRRVETPGTGRLTSALILLAVGSGAVDAFSFAALGAVFASVMTGNLVLLGVALVHARLDPALSAAVAIAAYAAGVFGAAHWLRHTRHEPAPGAGRPDRVRRHRPPWDARSGPARPTRTRGGGAGHARGGLPRGRRPAQRRTAEGGPRRGAARRYSGVRRPVSGVARWSRGRAESGRAHRARRRWECRGWFWRVRGGPVLDGRGYSGVRRPAAGVVRRARVRRESVRLRRALTAVPAAQVAVLAVWLACDGHPARAARLGSLALSAFAMGVQSAGVNTLPVAGAATTYLTGTLTSLTTELATSGVPATMRRRFAVLAAALAGAALNAALLTWVRPAAPVLPFASALTVLVLLGRAHLR